MDKYFKINGSITYDALGGSLTIEFDRISKLRTIKNPDIYYVYAGGRNLYNTCYSLNVNNKDNGIVLNGKRYFGKALHNLYIELQNLETEEALEELE
jgi:hypothetical protein